MTINLFNKFYPMIEKCSSLIHPRLLTGHHSSSADRFRFHSNKALPPKLGLRKLNLPSYPDIEVKNKLDDVQSFLPSQHKIIKIGDYDFIASADDYVQIYVQGYHQAKNIDGRAGFAVYFGKNHPLNLWGDVVRRQAINHAKIYALVKALEQIPQNLIQNVCLCLDETGALTFVSKHLRMMSENSFRSVYSGKLNLDLETSMELNRLLRTRQDILKLRMKYIPSDINVSGMYFATRLAKQASYDATQRFNSERYEKDVSRNQQ